MTETASEIFCNPKLLFQWLLRWYAKLFIVIGECDWIKCPWLLELPRYSESAENASAVWFCYTIINIGDPDLIDVIRDAGIYSTARVKSRLTLSFYKSFIKLLKRVESKIIFISMFCFSIRPWTPASQLTDVSSQKISKNNLPDGYRYTSLFAVSLNGFSKDRLWWTPWSEPSY